MPSFEVLSCTGRDAARWQSLIDQLPLEYRDIFFTPAYARVQEVAGQGSCHAAVYIWQEFFVLQPFLKHGLELTTFYGGAGPISNLMGKGDYRLWLWLEQAFAQWRKEQGITCEYVRLHPMFARAQRRMLREAPVNVEHLREAVVVNIDQDDEKLLNSFSRNRQRGVKDAGGSKITLTKDTSLFSHHYSLAMEKLGADVGWQHSQAAWTAYLNELGEEHCSILKADTDKLYSMLLVLHGYGRAYAHYLCDPWRAGNADLLYYQSMKHCRDLGCKTYFLGGGTTSDPSDPLLAYKSGFSKSRVPVSFYRRSFEKVPTHADSLTAQPA